MVGAIGAATAMVLTFATARPPQKQAASRSGKVQTLASPRRRAANQTLTLSRTPTANGHNDGSVFKAK